MTDNAPSKHTTSLLVAVVSTWLLLVILVLWFVGMVGDGRNDPLRHALSARLMLFGSIMTVLCIVQILAGILDGWIVAAAASGILCLYPIHFVVVSFWGCFLEMCFRSPEILSMGLFAPPDKTRFSVALRWWAYVTCLSPLAFIFGLPYWQDFHIPIVVLVIGLFVSSTVIAFGVLLLQLTISTSPLRWTLVSNQQQQHASSQHDCNIDVKVECVAERYYHDNIIRAFRGPIPLEVKLQDNPDSVNSIAYHVTNSNSETIVLVTPKRWIELTPEDPDAFLDAITQALWNQSTKDNIDGDEGSATATEVTTATCKYPDR